MFTIINNTKTTRNEIAKSNTMLRSRVFLTGGPRVESVAIASDALAVDEAQAFCPAVVDILARHAALVLRT